MGIHRWSDPQRARVRGHFGSGPMVPTIFLYDEFNDTNGTALADHTMDIGPGWTDDSDSWEINSNRALTSEHGATAFTDASVNHYDVSVEMGSQADLELLFRYVDANNFWTARVRDDPGDGWVCEVMQVLAGVQTQEHQVTVTIPGVFPHSLRALVTATGMEIFFDGISRFTHNSVQHAAATLVGFRSKALIVAGDSDCRTFTGYTYP